MTQKYIQVIDHILSLESGRKLDLTPNDQSNFASSRNESAPRGMKTSYSLPVGVRDSEKGGVKASSPLEALQMQLTVIIRAQYQLPSLALPPPYTGR